MFAPQANRRAFDNVHATYLWQWLAGLLVLVVLGLTAQAASAAGAEYRLGPGDKIKVTVFGQPNMSGQFSIAGDGNVSLPFIGSVNAGGQTIRQLESLIIDRLQPDYLKNPRVSVEVLNFRPFDIIGEVQKPGSYPYRNGMTVLNAVAMAGGFTYRAKEDRFRIRRAASGQFEKAGRNTVVLPGDVIEVLERWF
jgi:protein involved in polysaccharide export with SLBB domain